jgi:hypothetical protein
MGYTDGLYYAHIDAMDAFHTHKIDGTRSEMQLWQCGGGLVSLHVASLRKDNITTPMGYIMGPLGDVTVPYPPHFATTTQWEQSLDKKDEKSRGQLHLSLFCVAPDSRNLSLFAFCYIM